MGREEEEVEMTHEEWERTVPEEIKSDVVLRLQAYRTGDVCSRYRMGRWMKLSRNRQAVSLADQLYRALGSISTNITEGYSRSSKREQARFYEYALGSAREARDWYFKARHALGESSESQGINLLTQIIRLLLTMIP